MNILNQIDEFFEQQKESEQKVFFFLPILLFGFLSYYFIYPITDSDLNNAIRKDKSLHQEISKTTSSNQRLKRENLQIASSIKKIDKELKELKINQKEVDNLVAQLSFLKFDLNKWAKFYNDIPTIAKNHHLIINSLQNSMILDTQTSKLVEKKMEVIMNVSGNFIDFLRFVNTFESKKEFVKVKSLRTNGSNMLVVIDIYGAKL